MFRTKSERTGLAAVALVLIVGASFMLMTAGAGDTVILGMQNASRNSYNNRTSYAAYGALQESLDELNTNFAYACDNINNKTPLPEDPDILSGISVYNNNLGAATITAPDGKTVPSKMAYIKVKAEFKDFPGRFDTALNARAYIGLFLPDTLILGTSKVVLNNTTVDSVGVSTSNTWYPSLTSARIVCNAITPACINITAPSSTPPTLVRAHLSCGPAIDAAAEPGVVASAISVDPLNTVPATYVRKCLHYPARVARFRPYTDPKVATDAGAADDQISTSDWDLDPKREYRNFSADNCKVTLYPGNYYVADSVTITNANITLAASVTGDAPVMFYVGKNITITNSTVNWVNHPDSTNYATQQFLGPRTLQFYFVGSGRPRTLDNVLTIAANSKVSFHAAGKAMVVKMSDSEAWGGFKGFAFEAVNSKLHYHRTALQPPLPCASAEHTRVANNQMMWAGQLAALSPSLFPYLLNSAVLTFSTYPAQRNPYSAWSTEGMADDEAEGNEVADDYSGGYGY